MILFFYFVDYEDVVVTISYILHGGSFNYENKPEFSECWCAVQVRNANHSIGHYVEKWKLKMELVQKSDIERISIISPSETAGLDSVELFKLKPCFD